ncbi:type III secretion system inner membrane ring lipoprotein SctJ [Aquabacterium sp. OR-4]|uniref:type III secretion system inner membrane ring lipoprotein SctJ n=1 Tax=Aquabacterium sp. OR-4 TaxID=2978127 RepID=UPI0021B2B80A|nr:type III secretion inner membrane ring lipoprotein SctJ [Aquabacterium sp. OR-4]MDT7836047.1 type III secretion inner membrane ring lipoprotein SctJ [Aquabacterium sp. OR-4]
MSAALAPRATRGLRLALAALALLALGACKTSVYTRLSEAEANDALYTLLQGGLDAEKRSDPDAGYSVWADKSDLARAIGLLKANAQPEAKHPTLGELFGRNQLISTPAEERVRFVYGTEQALAQTLSKIDGVLVARVHIVLPANDPLATELKPSSASVFIKHRAGDDLASAVPAVKDLVVRGVEGLSIDRVAVTLFATQGPRGSTAAVGAGGAALPLDGSRFLGVPVPAGSVAGLWWRFGLLLAALAAVWAFSRRGAGSLPERQARLGRPAARDSIAPSGFRNTGAGAASGAGAGTAHATPRELRQPHA